MDRWQLPRPPGGLPGNGTIMTTDDTDAQANHSIFGDAYSKDSRVVEKKYDRFADEGSYDETFERWGYVSPLTAAAIMRNFVPVDARILDAACGSGLTGTALRNTGYRRIDGIDISRSLLDLARETGVYTKLSRVDMQRLPLPLDDNLYGAVNFIGALTYFETTDILEELCRIVQPGGHIVFSQRDDIMREQNYADQLDEIVHRGCWARVFATEPMPYLPGNPDYAGKIRVQYFVYRVAG